MTGKEFAKWMDEVGIDLAAAGAHFGVSNQTIYNWRSTNGVPASRADWVRSRMRDYISGSEFTSLPERITLEVTPEQFDEWSQAALAEGKILRQWAIDSLDAAAEADADTTGSSPAPNPLHSLPLVADEGKDYSARPDSESATTARLGSSYPTDSGEGAA